MMYVLVYSIDNISLLGLTLAVGLVVDDAIVIYLFTGHATATIIPGLAVPLSLISTFGMMYVLVYSIDNISRLWWLDRREASIGVTVSETIA
ncbi:efflux RND transporter permease subunit, partial [Rhizobium ruizarguesonis]